MIARHPKQELLLFRMIARHPKQEHFAVSLRVWDPCPNIDFFDNFIYLLE